MNSFWYSVVEVNGVDPELKFSLGSSSQTTGFGG